MSEFPLYHVMECASRRDDLSERPVRRGISLWRWHGQEAAVVFGGRKWVE